jgi:UDP-N-acetylglucosamine 2-epimerase (non-hydrolysing)/GDP/UDP-N,N'-diacetylbacillosamine 2-epimerase (hydrolysing)
MSKRICFITGTRAEFGLMRSALSAIRAHRGLNLQIIATGMHLDRSRGNTLAAIRADGWPVDDIVPWKPGDSPTALAAATGAAITGIAKALDHLKSDIALVVGDRVEAFAGATAAAISGRVVAHVHGGDRALGQLDDSLRHAITKLAHIHFPATAASAARIKRLGEEPSRIHCVGSPGIDGIQSEAIDPPFDLTPHRYILLVLHPTSPDDALEFRRACSILSAALSVNPDRVVIIHPNTDPGSSGIVGAWQAAAHDPRCLIAQNVSRPIFLGLLRDAALIAGNSSSGIIEAASFQTPVLNIGPRQLGRECADDVVHVTYSPREIKIAVATIWNNGRPRRSRCRNPYAAAGGHSDAGTKIAAIIGKVKLDERLLRKLITY